MSIMLLIRWFGGSVSFFCFPYAGFLSISFGQSSFISYDVGLVSISQVFAGPGKEKGRSDHSPTRPKVRESMISKIKERKHL